MSRIALLVPIAIFLALAAVFGLGLTRDPSSIPSELIDRPLPEFDLPPIAGRELGLATRDLSGEVSMVNIFGSWCVSCRIEHPLLMEIARSGEAPIHAVNWKDKPGDGSAWLARFGDPYRRIGDDPEGRVIIDLGVTGAPETFIIDKAGRVRYKHVGPITPEAWTKTIRPLIMELKNA